MDEETKGGGILETLKSEWALFWASLSEDDDQIQNKHYARFEEKEVPELLKSLSSQRNQINKKLESIKREIELSTAKVESLRLVGSDFSEIEEGIQELSNEGFRLSEDLSRLDEKLKQVHNSELESEVG